MRARTHTHTHARTHARTHTHTQNLRAPRPAPPPQAAMVFNTTKEHFAALIDAQFTGPELKDLISNDIQLSRITDTINMCSQPPGSVPAGTWRADPITALLKDMLKEKLSFRIVEAILDAGARGAGRGGGGVGVGRTPHRGCRGALSGPSLGRSGTCIACAAAASKAATQRLVKTYRLYTYNLGTARPCCPLSNLCVGSMNEATVFTNFRPGNQLFNVYPPELYRPKYTHHFVQLLLTNWKRGQRDGQVRARALASAPWGPPPLGAPQLPRPRARMHSRSCIQMQRPCLNQKRTS